MVKSRINKAHEYLMDYSLSGCERHSGCDACCCGKHMWVRVNVCVFPLASFVALAFSVN